MTATIFSTTNRKYRLQALDLTLKHKAWGVQWGTAPMYLTMKMVSGSLQAKQVSRQNKNQQMKILSLKVRQKSKSNLMKIWLPLWS
jgi:hypothetical protein